MIEEKKSRKARGIKETKPCAEKFAEMEMILEFSRVDDQEVRNECQ